MPQEGFFCKLIFCDAELPGIGQGLLQGAVVGHRRQVELVGIGQQLPEAAVRRETGGDEEVGRAKRVLGRQ